VLFQGLRHVFIGTEWLQSGICMAIKRIILLAGETEGPYLAAILRSHEAKLSVDHVNSVDELNAATAEDVAGARLVSFCSSVIVPAAVLSRLPGPSYNFHPGPPEYPGRYPSMFALYDGAERFGITVHEMVAKVDAGPIVGAEWFNVPATCDLNTLDEFTYATLADKFRTLSFHLAILDQPLRRLPYRWGTRKTKRADSEALRIITADMDAAEIARRKRACGGNVIDP
jgi:methionyl-tRNA formyltransferase